jgi:hypothetical protein
MSKRTTLTGGCLCGAVRYEVRDLDSKGNSIVCHCRMCQRASGAPLTGLFFMAADDVRVTKGRLCTYRSSPTVDRLFCPRCGSPIFFQRTNLPGRRGIFAGSLDDPNEFKPNLQVCTTSAVSWLSTLSAVPSFAEKPDEMLKVAPVVDYDPVTGRVSEPRRP